MKKVLIALLALALVGGSHNAQATTTTTTLPGKSVKKSAEFTATLSTAGASATPLFDVATETNNAYMVDISVIARGTAGTDQGKGKAIKCYVGAQNIAGTTTVGSLICQTATGGLTATGLAVTTDGTNIQITAAGAASQSIAWVAKVKVITSAEANVTTTTTSTSTTTT
jgi:hypothetical protein